MYSMCVSLAFSMGVFCEFVCSMSEVLIHQFCILSKTQLVTDVHDWCFQFWGRNELGQDFFISKVVRLFINIRYEASNKVQCCQLVHHFLMIILRKWLCNKDFHQGICVFTIVCLFWIVHILNTSKNFRSFWWYFSMIFSVSSSDSQGWWGYLFQKRYRIVLFWFDLRLEILAWLGSMAHP